jgi:hypothetical protein
LLNSTLGGVLAAVRAGLRAFDMSMPEDFKYGLDRRKFLV